MTGDQGITSGSLVDISGLTYAAAANSSYIFEARLNVSVNSGTAGAQFGCQYSNATKGNLGCNCRGSQAVTAINSGRITAWFTAGPVVNGAAVAGWTEIFGYFTTGAAAANFTIQALKVTNQTLTVYAGSFLKISKVA